VQFALLATAVILIGGLVEVIPTYLVKSNVPTIASVKPYTPLELQGRDLYVREGCYTCHSQMVRPFRSETERYGEYSKAGEYVYDHPFQWGSKRTGPDLHRVGGKFPNLWHYLHMNEPPSMSPGSIMPAYPWLLTQDLDISTTAAKIRTMQRLGVPYPAGYDARAVDDLKAQSETIASDLIKAGIPADPQKEIIALIAYLQRLGTDIRITP
jgi:cytochrome c oxidase cbb3-type subunit I/II